MSNVELTKAVAINPDQSEFEVMQRQCKMAVMSRMLPEIYNQGDQTTQMAKAVVVAMKGRELGIPMMQAFSQINVIKGKPTISAELMLALIYRAHPNAEINFTTLSNEACVIKAKRPGSSEFTELAFTIQDAQNAGLAGGHSWKKYPRAMLRSRAVSEMARTLFPDAIMGCSYTPEELGAEVNMEGETVQEPKNAPREEIIEVTASQPQENKAPETRPHGTMIVEEGLGQYQIQAGKQKGKFLKDEPKDFWANWVVSIETWVHKNGGEPKGMLAIDIAKAKAYCGEPIEQDFVEAADAAWDESQSPTPNFNETQPNFAPESGATL